MTLHVITEGATERQVGLVLYSRGLLQAVPYELLRSQHREGYDSVVGELQGPDGLLKKLQDAPGLTKVLLIFDQESAPTPQDRALRIVQDLRWSDPFWSSFSFVNPHKAVFSPSDLIGLPYWNKLSPDRGQCARMEEAAHPTALWRTLQNIGNLLTGWTINFGGKSISFLEVVLWGRPLVADRYRDFLRILGPELAYLSGVLGQAHKSAHMEKEETPGDSSDELTTPFGYHFAELKSLNQRLEAVLDPKAAPIRSQRPIDFQKVRLHFGYAPGDTRYPINEVTLWDWSSIVAALYKAEIARYVLTWQQRSPSDIAWRLLSIRTSGLEYLLSAPSVPDLLARRALLTDAWNRVQTLLEETYPLGLEVYRDENGPVFVVPDLDNLLDCADTNGKTLRALIQEEFAAGTVTKGSQSDPRLALEGEIVPELCTDSEPWKGQPTPDELPPIAKNWKNPQRKGHLEETPVLTAEPGYVLQFWQVSQNQEEICIVCGLRPQGPSKKARERRLCDICEERRADRSMEWAGRLDRTIWVDEVADTSGRLALIVGTFDLTRWLTGDLVRSLVVRDPASYSDKTNKEIPKNPSFARLRRIWETTRRFWREVCPTDEAAGLANSLVGQAVGRPAPGNPGQPEAAGNRRDPWPLPHLRPGPPRRRQTERGMGRAERPLHHLRQPEIPGGPDPTGPSSPGSPETGHNASGAEEVLQTYTEEVLGDLDTLLLVRDLYEQILIYARYGAKAAGG